MKLFRKKKICRGSIIFCAYGRSVGWTEGTREKVVPLGAAGRHHAGFMPARMKKAARTYMFASVLGRGRGIFNSHFNIFSDSHLARSSHLRYVTCARHTPPATAIPPLPLLPAEPTPPHAFFTPSIPLPAVAGCRGASAAPVGAWLGTPPSSPSASQTHPSPPQSAVSPSPPSPLVQWESRWVIGSRLKILIIHEAGKGLGGGGGGCWGGGGVGR